MRRAVWALGVLACCVSGCGGESSFEDGDGDGRVATCNEFTPCGGDVVGSWEITETCIDPSVTVAIGDCSDTAVDYRSYEVDGEYVFDASGNVTVTFDSRFSYVWDIPRSCFSDYTCTEMETLLNSATSTGTSTIEFSATCPEAPTVCRCEITGSIAGTNVATYTTSGSTLTIVSADSESTQQYCVDGDDLTMRAEGGEFVLTRN
jgi:hypothetical protein